MRYDQTSNFEPCLVLVGYEDARKFKKIIECIDKTKLSTEQEVEYRRLLEFADIE